MDQTSTGVAALVVATLAITCGAGAQPSRALVEARRHMLDPEINTLTFRSMEALFDVLRVENEGQPSALPEAPATLDFAYEFEGQRRPAEAGSSARTRTRS